jgi:AMP phosphorylase
MVFKARKIDIQTKDAMIALIHTNDSEKYGISAGDQIYLTWEGEKMGLALFVDVTNSITPPGTIGLFEDFWNEIKIYENTDVQVDILHDGDLRKIIAKKLLGNKLEPEEIDKVILDIATGKANPVMTAYYVGAGYSPGFDFDEILYMTSSMANTGDKLKFDKMTIDKHSVGGVAGKGLTPLIIPIISCLEDVIVPNTSSKAVTSASATADMLECIMDMSFSIEKLYEFINKQNCFMVWGGGLNLAPADDKIIRVQKQLGIESNDKLVSSIMAKKIAQGVTHVLFDIPVGTHTKIKTDKDAAEVEEIFIKIAKHFNINIEVHKRRIEGIDGFGVGPNIECREFLRIYEGDELASAEMLEEALVMSGKIIELAGQAPKSMGKAMALDIFRSGRAEEKFRKIVESQNGNPNIKSTDLLIGSIQNDIRSTKDGTLKSINNTSIFSICKALGNPFVKHAGIYFYKKVGDDIKVGDVVATIYAGSDTRMDFAMKIANQLDMWEIT